MPDGLKNEGMTDNHRDAVMFARSSRTVSGRLHDELVMMDMSQGRYYSLNSVATRIWDMLEEPMDVAALCGKLEKEYDTEHSRCLEEVQALLDEMISLGLVVKII